MSTSKEPTPFEQWYNGMVGFHINSERILDDFKYDIGGGYEVDPIKLRKWMVVCWNAAIQEASLKGGSACSWEEQDTQDKVEKAIDDLQEPLT